MVVGTLVFNREIGGLSPSLSRSLAQQVSSMIGLQLDQPNWQLTLLPKQSNPLEVRGNLS